MRQCGKWILKSKAVFGVMIFLGLALPVAAAIVYSPGNPNVEQTVTFTVDTPGASEIDWDFGDGSPVVFTDGASVEHVFNRRGTYLVIANFLVGPETVTVTIQKAEES